MTLNHLYQEMIKEHSKNPRNFKKLADATHVIRGRNPLCGDDYWVYIKIDQDRVVGCSFEGDGCAISKSSSSMLTQHVIGLSIKEAQDFIECYLAMLTEEKPLPKEKMDLLKRLKIFETVKHYPMRVKCSTLSFRAFEQALQQHNGQNAADSLSVNEITTE